MTKRRLPDFIIAGATRSGTSTLHDILSVHSEIFMAPEKELQFFCRNELYNRGLDFYARFFEAAEPSQICGECSPPYFEKGIIVQDNLDVIYDEQDDAPARIREALPDAKIVFTLRHPVVRAYSEFMKNLWQGRETEADFEKALREEAEGKRSIKTDTFSWLYRNHYKIHLGRWLELFPREQIFVLIFDEWSKDPQSELVPLQKFLGIQSPLVFTPSVKKKNQGRQLRHPALLPLANKFSRHFRFINRIALSKPGYPPLQPGQRERLMAYFDEDNLYVSKLLGRDSNIW